MLDHPTLDQLKTLRLDGMAEAFAEMQTQDGTADLTHAEWLGLLIDRETASRETKRFESRMRTAKLRHVGLAGPKLHIWAFERTNAAQIMGLIAAGTWRRFQQAS